MKFSPKVKAVQLLMNKKGGSTLKPDGLFGAYTSETTKMLSQAMGLPRSNILTKEFIRRLVEAEDKRILPESFEHINIIEYNLTHADISKIYEWIKRKNPRTVLTAKDIAEIYGICSCCGFSFLHCIAHLINESAWGTSYRIRNYNNGFGIGIYDSGDKYKLKYLVRPTSAQEWCSLLNRLYIPRGQVTEQLLNISYYRRWHRENPEALGLKKVPKSWRGYASSQSKSVSCGMLVREMRELLKL